MLLPDLHTETLIHSRTIKEWVKLDPTRGFAIRDLDIEEQVSGSVDDDVAKLKKYLTDNWRVSSFAETGGTFMIDGTEFSPSSRRLLRALYGLGREQCGMPLFVNALSLGQLVVERKKLVVFGEDYTFFDFLTKHCDFLVVNNFTQLSKSLVSSSFAADFLSGVLSARLGHQPITILVTTGTEQLLQDAYPFLWAKSNEYYVCADFKLGEKIYG